MVRTTFLDWVRIHEGRGLYGQDEGNEKSKFNLPDRIRDNEIAEGDVEEEFRQLALSWANASNDRIREHLKKKVDDYAFRLQKMGYSMNRIQSIMASATHGQFRRATRRM